MLKPTAAIARPRESASRAACHHVCAPKTRREYDAMSQAVMTIAFRPSRKPPCCERPVRTKYSSTRLFSSAWKPAAGPNLKTGAEVELAASMCLTSRGTAEALCPALLFPCNLTGGVRGAYHSTEVVRCIGAGAGWPFPLDRSGGHADASR